MTAHLHDKGFNVEYEGKIIKTIMNIKGLGTRLTSSTLDITALRGQNQSQKLFFIFSLNF